MMALKMITATAQQGGERLMLALVLAIFSISVLSHNSSASDGQDLIHACKEGDIVHVCIVTQKIAIPKTSSSLQDFPYQFFD